MYIIVPRVLSPLTSRSPPPSSQFVICIPLPAIFDCANKSLNCNLTIQINLLTSYTTALLQMDLSRNQFSIISIFWSKIVDTFIVCKYTLIMIKKKNNNNNNNNDNNVNNNNNHFYNSNNFFFPKCY